MTSRNSHVSIIADEQTLFVTVVFPAATDGEEIAACLFQIAGAFAAIEQLDERQMQGLMWERKSRKNLMHSFVLRREFSDPKYPERFEQAFRRLSLGDERCLLH
jgi:hypothetical protein